MHTCKAPPAGLTLTPLANGAVVLSVHRPWGQGVAVGLWWEHGVRHQGAGEAGYAHLLEHGLLADDPRHPPPPWLDPLGGWVNAHSGRELTALTGWVSAPRALALARWICQRLVGLRGEVATAEGPVLVQEIREAQSPRHTLETLGLERAFNHHPVARPLGALPEVPPTAAALEAHLQAHRLGRRLALVAVGPVDHTALVAAAAPLATLPPGERPLRSPPPFQGGRYTLSPWSPHEAAGVWLWPLPAPAAAHHPAHILLTHTLKREWYHHLRRQGLVYGLAAAGEYWTDGGVYRLVWQGPRPQRDQVEAALAEVVAAFKHQPTDALATSRRQLAEQLAVADDDTLGLMDRWARGYFHGGGDVSTGAWQRRLAAIDDAQVVALLNAGWARGFALLA
ncbi:MAG: insulinase family protein [Candidatus Competibacterales bacterium]